MLPCALRHAHDADSRRTAHRPPRAPSVHAGGWRSPSAGRAVTGTEPSGGGERGIFPSQRKESATVFHTSRGNILRAREKWPSSNGLESGYGPRQTTAPQQ
jgi:hypothetical protein